MGDDTEVDAFIAQWRNTGGSELTNTQSFINGLRRLIEVAPPDVSRTDFKGKRASTVCPVLNALAGVVLARRLTDGRYAA